jgi:hypothetical protein
MPKLRILKNIASPEMLLSEAKNAYADLMLRAGNKNTAGIEGKLYLFIRVKNLTRGCRLMKFTRTFQQIVSYLIPSRIYFS